MVRQSRRDGVAMESSAPWEQQGRACDFIVTGYLYIKVAMDRPHNWYRLAMRKLSWVLEYPFGVRCSKTN